MKAARGTWIAGIILALVLPAALIAGWSVLVLGGSIEAVREREVNEARGALALYRERFGRVLTATSAQANAASGVVWLDLDRDGRAQNDRLAQGRL